MSNLRQLGNSILMMSNETPNGNFPVGTGGAWPWDCPRAITDPLIEKYGATRDLFYCPAQPQMNSDSYWEFSNYRVIGYVFLMKGVPQVPTDRAQVSLRVNKMPTDMKQRRGIDPNSEPPSSKTELVVDAVISQGGDYKNVSGGLDINRSNHMESDLSKPLGANIMFKDGHVEWRPFEDMHPEEKFGNPQFQY